MPTFDDSFLAVLSALRDRYGRPAGLAPAEPFLAVAAAVLAGDVSPQKAISARAAMGEANFLDPATLAAADAVDVAEVFRETPLGLKHKAIGTLLRLARWLSERDQGDEGSLADRATETLREELAAINGIGRATADRLLLHALRRPVYPLDRATYRVFVRHGWLEPSADYDEARGVVERPLANDPPGLGGFATLMELVGREFCRVGAPRCERCPLRPWLPETGPVDPSV
ncbi:MAG: endonuclease III [Isosphaeraceae bacterium]|nr:endonuclease III [Isosphaeraceae bacterium]